MIYRCSYNLSDFYDTLLYNYSTVETEGKEREEV